jgi:hypothetical protein
MRVLFDQGTPVPLRRFLSSHTVTTVYEKGWSRTPNGDLLRLADQEMFEVFLTTDQRLRYQQNLTEPPDRYSDIADDKLADDPETHGQDSRSPRLNSSRRFHRN